MLVTFRHDGTGRLYRGDPVQVEVTAAEHTAHGECMAGRNWLVWDGDDPFHADTFAEAVFGAAMLAADTLGGVVLAEVEGVAVPADWDAIALLTASWQADPPFSDWPEAVHA